MNLLSPSCPRFQNLGNMNPEIRTNLCKTNMKFDFRSSYEFMCRIFNDEGKVQDENGLWKTRESFKAGSTLCKICGTEMGGGYKNIHQAMKKDHLQIDVGPSCKWCNLTFGEQLGENLEQIRNAHMKKHGQLASWTEIIWDYNGQFPSSIHYEIKFND